jgi:hypothetical protein
MSLTDIKGIEGVLSQMAEQETHIVDVLCRLSDEELRSVIHGPEEVIVLDYEFIRDLVDEDERYMRAKRADLSDLPPLEDVKDISTEQRATYSGPPVSNIAFTPNTDPVALSRGVTHTAKIEYEWYSIPYAYHNSGDK